VLDGYGIAGKTFYYPGPLGFVQSRRCPAEEDATSVNEIMRNEEMKGESATYDLGGRRIYGDKPTGGILIHKGVKVKKLKS